jgi:DNA-binding CsgD family transcriptional regulator
MSIAMPETENDVITPAANSSWRTWLMTGVRRGPIYRRRVRGAHKGLKRMLVEGMGDGVEDQNGWKGFSGAMVRQAVGEAVSSLPQRQRQLIKLAYFSDLSNREIAKGLGITLSSVERGLRQAIGRVSEQVERGRTAGRRAIYALAMFLGGRWLSEAHQSAGASAPQWVRAGTLLLATAAAGVVLAVPPPPPASPAHVEQASIPVVVSVPTDEVLQQRVGLIRHATESVGQPAKATVPNAGGTEVATPTLPSVAGVDIAPPTVAVPTLTVPMHVTVPPLPNPSVVHGLLGA